MEIGRRIQDSWCCNTLKYSPRLPPLRFCNLIQDWRSFFLGDFFRSFVKFDHRLCVKNREISAKPIISTKIFKLVFIGVDALLVWRGKKRLCWLQTTAVWVHKVNSPSDCVMVSHVDKQTALFQWLLKRGNGICCKARTGTSAIRRKWDSI